MGKPLPPTRLEQLAGLGSPNVNQVPAWNGTAYVPASLQGTGGGTVRTLSLDPNASLYLQNGGNNSSALTLSWKIPIAVSVGSLPGTAFQGQFCFATNGRKAGEGSGSGTGVPVYFDGSNWRTFYDNSIVQA